MRICQFNPSISGVYHRHNIRRDRNCFLRVKAQMLIATEPEDPRYWNLNNWLILGNDEPLCGQCFEVKLKQHQGNKAQWEFHTHNRIGSLGISLGLIPTLPQPKSELPSNQPE